MTSRFASIEFGRRAGLPPAAFRHSFRTFGPVAAFKARRMKDAYGVSISTLRELLNRLTSEGLVLAEGARGFEVAPVSPENLKEIANLRQLLECHALERSFAAGDMEWEGARCCRPSQARHDGETGHCRRARSGRIAQALRLGVSSGAAVGVRLEGASGSATVPSSTNICAT